MRRQREPSQQVQYPLRFHQTFFDHFFVAEPEVGYVGGTQAQNVFERAAHLAAPKVHADAVQEFNQGRGAFRGDRSWRRAVAVQPMVGDQIRGSGSRAVPGDVQEAMNSRRCRRFDCQGFRARRGGGQRSLASFNYSPTCCRSFRICSTSHWAP